VLPERPDPKKPSPTRVGIWIVVAGIGVYMLGTGIFGILAGGG
jgi:hypothetical protein